MDQGGDRRPSAGMKCTKQATREMLNEGPSLGASAGTLGWGRRRAARRSAGTNESTRHYSIKILRWPHSQRNALPHGKAHIDRAGAGVRTVLRSTCPSAISTDALSTLMISLYAAVTSSPQANPPDQRSDQAVFSRSRASKNLRIAPLPAALAALFEVAPIHGTTGGLS